MRIDDQRKVCWAKAGDVIQLVKDGEPQPGYWLVSKIPNAQRQAQIVSRAIESNGLYSAKEDFFMTNLESGEIHPLPHLSSKCFFRRDATLVLASDDR